MTDTATAQPPAPQPAQKSSFTGSRWFIAAVIVSVALIGFGVGRLTSWRGYWGHHWSGWGQSESYGPRYGQGDRGYGERGSGPGWRHGEGMMRRGEWEGGAMFGRGPERMLVRALDSVNATADQRQKIETIARDAFTELRPLRQTMREARQQLATLLKAETIDKAAIERLRAERAAAMDAMSKRMADAVTQAAEVLTPTQRQQLIERWESRRHWMRG